MEEKKETKQRKSMTLKPINITWLANKSFEESTPEHKVSDSELVDRLIDEAREREEPPSPTKQKKTARAVNPLHAVLA